MAIIFLSGSRYMLVSGMNFANEIAEAGSLMI